MTGDQAWKWLRFLELADRVLTAVAAGIAVVLAVGTVIFGVTGNHRDATVTLIGMGISVATARWHPSLVRFRDIP